MRTPDPSIPTPVERPGRRAYAALAGAIVGCAFLALASVGLDRQGLDYDEVHQAPAAFFYIGGEPAMFAHSFQGVPILNMRYSGAIKSTLYGLYLRFGGGHFTVASWRLLGLGLVAAGVFAFCWTAAAWLPMSSAVLFGALFITDASVLLMARHDWGPIALSLALRLAFLSAWVALHGNPTPARCVVAGVMLGVALFEKLSAVVLLVPFVILLWEMRTSFPRVWKAAGAGLALGALPLLFVNVGSLLLGSGLISLADVDVGRAFSQGSPFAFFSDYLSLGQGVGARFHVLGATKPSLPRAEALLVLVLLAIVGAAWRHGDARWRKLAASCALSYLLIGLALFLIPHPTSVHHWILGTPFHYAACAIALAGLSGSTHGRSRMLRAALVIAAAALVLVRVPTMVAVERALAEGRSSERFDPDFTRVAELASARAGDAVFVSADWGTGTQIYCLGNGRADLVVEPFWYPDPAAHLQTFLMKTGKPTAYVLVTGIAPQFAATSASIAHAMAQAPGWQEAPIEAEFAALHRVRIRKFVRVRPG